MATSVSAFDASANPRSLKLPDVAALVGRVFLASIFVLSGAGKAADPVATLAYIETAGLPFAQFCPIGAVLIEVGAGLALILGYRVRLAAVALALFSLVAAMIFHSAFTDQNQLIHFSKNVAMVGGLLQVLAFGGGRLSLDARISNNGRDRPIAG